MNKRIIIILGVGILSIGSYFIFKNVVVSLLIFVIYYCLDFYKKSAENTKENKLIQDKEYEFANLLSYLLVFLDNNFNVYQSLQLSLNYCKECLVKDVETLISEIDLDKSIIPYQNFASKFKSNIIYQIVMMIYQLDINGYDAKYLANFPSLINSLKQARIDSIIQSRKMNMSFMTIFPIIALLGVVFTLVFYILSMVGGNI